jgi:hypothetical protein
MKHLRTTWDEWHERHRRFPGVDFCIALLKRRNTQGELVDTIWAVLEQNAADHAQELLAAVESDENRSARLSLLGVLENATLEEAIPFWSRVLSGADATEQLYAADSLGSPTRERQWNLSNSHGF